jgi:hypothetical protein
VIIHTCGASSKRKIPGKLGRAAFREHDSVANLHLIDAYHINDGVTERVEDEEVIEVLVHKEQALVDAVQYLW